MNPHLRNYFRSFKLDTKFWKSFVIDFVALLMIFSFFFILTTNLNHQSEVIGEGKSIEQLKLDLVTGTEENAKQFLDRTKSIIFTMVFGGLTVLIASLLTFSYSRKFLWGKLFSHKTKLKSWVGLILVLTCFLLFYFLAFAIIKILFNILTATWLSNNIYQLISKLMSFIFLITFTIYTFLTFYSFQHHHKVWHSFSQAYNLIKKYWSRLWKMLLLILFTAILLSIILLFATKYLLPYNITLTITQVIIFLLFINWTRYYLLRTISAIK